MSVAIAGLIAAAEPSSAQSFLQRLFGFGARAPDYRSERMDGRMGLEGYSGRDGTDARDGYGGQWQEDYRTYRTVCVRMCDGFYFPVSDNVRRERLYHDSRACMQRCDGEARLFYYPTQGGSVETMVDMAGHTYASLPTAFLYRKSLVAGCACKPAPWSPEEAARHEGYAAEAAQAAAGAAAGGDGEMDQEELGRRAAAAAAEGEGPYYEEGPPEPRAYDPSRREYSGRMSRTPWARPRYGWRN